MKNIPHLLEQVRNVIRVKHYALNTEKSYLRWIKQFLLFHKRRHSSAMGDREIGEFLTHLAVNRNVADQAVSSQQSAVSIQLTTKEIK